MGALLAGSRGGIKKPTSDIFGNLFIKRLLSGEVGFEELYNSFITQSYPKNITLVVNNTCNLQCIHCYLQDNMRSTLTLSESEWKLVIDSIANIEPELICLSGKEVFLEDIGIHILSYLREIKDRKQISSRIGVITNGTLLHKYRNDISQLEPSYIDISVDGVEADHDAVRGKGAFSLTIPNVEWASKVFGRKFFVNLTLQKQNYTSFVETFDFFQKRGVQNISCGFYIPLSYTSRHLALAEGEIDFIFENLGKLESIFPTNPLNILLDLDIMTLQPLKAFLRSDWFSFDNVHQDANGEHYIEYCFDNGIHLKFRFAPYPIGIWRSTRITPDGSYIAAEDTINTALYSKRTIGSIRNFNYDFRALHSYALTSERFQELLHEYYYYVLPDLTEAAYCRHHSVSSVV